MGPRILTGIDAAGTHWLITDFGDTAEIATRRDASETWSAPVVTVEAQEVPC